MAGRERARRPLAVHAELALAALDLVTFRLGDVVRHVVHQRHAEPLSRPAEKLRERLTNQVHEQLPVSPGEVGRRPHRPEVPPTLGRIDRGADELSVRKVDAVLLRRVAKLLDGVLADLVAEASRPRMDHHADAALRQAQHRSRLLVEHLVDDLHLDEVVAAAQRAALVLASLVRTVGHAVGVGSLDAPAGLGGLEILGAPEALLDDPRGSVAEQRLHLAPVKLERPGSADAARDRGEQLVDQLADPPLDVVCRQVGSHESHAAVDVVSHAPGADHPAGLRVGGSHAPDAEPVAPVNVGHG